MTTRYRVEYALKTHRRDQLIEWIKGLLAVPFVLLSHPTNMLEDDHSGVQEMTRSAHERYAQIMQDVERLIADHITHQNTTHGDGGPSSTSKLQLLVPSVGVFFTPLPLRAAFEWQDSRRSISRRRFVAPSFNDVRLVLNTAQAMALVQDAGERLRLVTFDGDVTLYDDGQALTPDNACIARLLRLLQQGVRVGIVTAAGYTDAQHYYNRLYGLLDAAAAERIPSGRLVVMGGEANFLFAYDPDAAYRLAPVAAADWQLAEMRGWTEEEIQALLDVAEAALRRCVDALRMPVAVMRKPRAVGIYSPAGARLAREQLEETVLVVQRILETSAAGRRVPFCAFNGGNDVFVDIGDKSWGVRACQRYFGGIDAARSLHIGDQFLSAGANDFKARLACTTAWIASPEETVALLDEMEELRNASVAMVMKTVTTTTTTMSHSIDTTE